MSTSLEIQTDKVEDSAAEAEIKRLHQQWREIIKHLIEEKPNRFIQMLCEGVLAELGARESWLDPESDGTRGHYLTVAALVMANLTGTNFPPKPPSQYISMAQWIRNDFDSNHHGDRHLHYPHYESANSTPELVRIFFSSIIDTLELSVATATQLVYHGVPLYQYGVGDVALADEDSEISCYLRQRGSRYETVANSHMPGWASSYFFSAAHLKTYEVFFKSHWEQSDEEIAQLRVAYRHAVHVPLGATSRKDSIAPQKSASRLLDLLEAVRARYYGVNFLPSDTSSWPRQKDVVAWLRELHGLSEREAQAIDIVSRPDALRGK